MAKQVLVLHGMTMSGATMLRSLGPLASELQRAGYELLAPDGGHQLSARELDEFLAWLSPAYKKRGRDPRRSFRTGAFWDQKGQHFDWFRSQTDPNTGAKTYHALTRSLEVLARETAGRDVVGVVAFSQGAGLATLLEALCAQGDTRLSPVKFGIYMAGMAPQVTSPVVPRYPIQSKTARLLVLGDRDPLFVGGAAYLSKWAEAFSGESDRLVVDDLGHEAPVDAASVSRMMEFVRAHAG